MKAKAQLERLRKDRGDGDLVDLPRAKQDTGNTIYHASCNSVCVDCMLGYLCRCAQENTRSVI